MTIVSGPPRFPLTYRSSPNGRSHAAYAGNVRVGYCDERSHGRWTWQLIMLQPLGGAYLGRADTADEAKEQLEMGFYHWMIEAGLQPAVDLTMMRPGGKQPPGEDYPKGVILLSKGSYEIGAKAAETYGTELLDALNGYTTKEKTDAVTRQPTDRSYREPVGVSNSGEQAGRSSVKGPAAPRKRTTKPK